MKVGIFGTWGNGDIIISTPVLKYKETLWPKAQIVWITQADKIDIFAHNPFVTEVRTPENPNALPNEIFFSPGYSPTSFKKENPIVEDLDMLYFPVLWLHKNMLHFPYGLFHREIFGYDKSLPVHPCLFFTQQEDISAENFVSQLPNKWNIMLETECRSYQTEWNQQTTISVMDECRKILESCNFIFASPGSGNDFGVGNPGVVDCSSFSIRQCIPVYNRCHLFLGVSSGVSQATCSWPSNPSVPRIDYVRSENYSSKYIARGTAQSATNKDEFMSKIKAMLTTMKESIQ